MVQILTVQERTRQISKHVLFVSGHTGSFLRFQTMHYIPSYCSVVGNTYIIGMLVNIEILLSCVIISFLT
jgi:hypothetical protein